MIASQIIQYKTEPAKIFLPHFQEQNFSANQFVLHSQPDTFAHGAKFYSDDLITFKQQQNVYCVYRSHKVHQQSLWLEFEHKLLVCFRF